MNDDFIARFGAAANGSLYSAKNVAMTTFAERDDLLPCAHCGGAPRLADMGDDDFAVCCPECGVTGPFCEESGAAIIGWNQRTDTGRQAGLREAAEIARERAKNLRQSAARYRADLNATGEDRCEKAATYLEKAAEIIEARAKEKQP